MHEVTWYENNRENIMKRAKVTGSVNKKYFRSSFSDILMHWAPKEDVKYIKVSYGKGNFLEFDLYSSGPYLTYQSKMYKHIQPVEGLFFLMVRSDHKVGETASQVLALIENIGKNFSKFQMTNAEHWVTLDRMNEMLLEIEEIVENAEEYQVMDELMKSISSENN